MRNTSNLRPFLTRLALLWLALLIGGLIYAQQKNIPFRSAALILPGLLLEAGLYMAAGTEAVRKWLAGRFGPWMLACVATLAAVVPHLFLSIPGGYFSMGNLGVLLVLAASVAFWYVWFDRSTIADLGFVLVPVAAALSGVFSDIYGEPIPKLKLGLLGYLAIARTGIISSLLIGKWQNVGVGFIPEASESWIGVKQFLLFLPVSVVAAYFTGFAKLEPAPMAWATVALALGTFLANLWGTAFYEEFLFRGLLQQTNRSWLKKQWVALAVTSVLFGLVHLNFAHKFPNWRFVFLATLAGWFYGKAYEQGRGIRAAMVTHSLVNTLYRVLLH